MFYLCTSYRKYFNQTELRDFTSDFSCGGFNVRLLMRRLKLMSSINNYLFSKFFYGKQANEKYIAEIGHRCEMTCTLKKIYQYQRIQPKVYKIISPFHQFQRLIASGFGVFLFDQYDLKLRVHATDVK